MFIMNIPWRNVARMSGVLSDKQVLALLDVVNRKKGSIKKLAESLKKNGEF